MAVAGLVAVIALVAGIVMLADHKSSRGAIFVVAAVVAVIVAVFARPRLTHMAILRPRWRAVVCEREPGFAAPQRIARGRYADARPGRGRSTGGVR
jgi:hypothetical protein